MQLSRYLKNIDSFIAAIIGFYVVYLFTNYSGIGISPDSIMYTSAARSLNTDGTLTTFNNLPLVDFPVFYPLFLGIIQFITRVDPIAAGPVIDGLLFAAVIFLSGWIMERFINTARIYKNLVLVIIILSPALLQVYTYLWSETLFILLSLVFIIAYKHYLLKHTIPALLLMALVAAIATITRYAGVTLIGTGGLLLLFDRNLNLKKKAIHIINYSLVACSLLILNLFRNALLTKTVTGPREPSVTSFGKNVYYFGTVICNWLNISEDYYDTLAAPLAWLILIFLVVVFVYNLLRNKANSYENIALTFALVYGLFIIISSTFSRYERINPRLLSPMFIPLLWSCTSWVISTFKHIRYHKAKRIAAWSAFSLTMLVFAVNELYADSDRYYDQNEYGNPGYTDDTWNKSTFVEFLEGNKHIYKPGVAIYSDANEAAYFTAGIKAKLLPHRFFTKKIAEFYAVKHYYLIWFNDLDNPELISLKDIVKQQKLIKLYDYPDGAVYEYVSEK
jgi:hypothetical protein